MTGRDGRPAPWFQAGRVQSVIVHMPYHFLATYRTEQSDQADVNKTPRVAFSRLVGAGKAQSKKQV